MIHTIHTSDTIAGIAARYYGSAARWREIVDANTLRHPYISADPIDQLGQRLALYTASAEINAGQLTISVPAGDSSLVQPGARLVLSQILPDGTKQLDICVVEAFASGVITLRTPPASAYPAGSAISVYPAPGELVGTVAKPGDRIVVPNVGDAAEVVSATDPYGRDVRADDGRIVFLGGDLALISGIPNLRQALRNRLGCEAGTMIQHPTYGCEAARYIGQVIGPTLIALVQSAVASSIVEDSRVDDVRSVEVEVEGDSIIVTARVMAGQPIDIVTAVG